MNGRVYAILREHSLIAIETELHGFTIVELLGAVDVESGDEVSWDSELDVGRQVYRNLSTKRTFEGRVRSHMVSRGAVRQHLQPL